MNNEETDKALDSVRRHLQAMLEKLDKMKLEQEEDLKSNTEQEKLITEAALAQTKKLIQEIRESQRNIELLLNDRRPSDL